MNRWSAIDRFKPALFDGPYAFLPMYYVGPREVVAGEPRGRVLLTLMQKLSTQVYFAEDVDVPVIGSIIDFHPSVENLVSNFKVVMCRGGVRVCSGLMCILKPTFVGVEMCRADIAGLQPSPQHVLGLR